MRTILRIFWKDSLIMMKDRGTIINLFVLPLVFSVVLTLALGGVFGGGASKTNAVTIPVQATGTNSQKLVDELKKIKGISWVDMSITDAKQQVDKGKRLGALELKDNGDKVDATYYENPDQLSNSRLVYGQIESVFAAIGREQVNTFLTQSLEQIPNLNIGSKVDDIKSKADLKVDEKVVGNKSSSQSEPTAAEQYFPGFTVAFVFFIASTIAHYMFTEINRGTLRRLLTSPVRKYAILIGKLLPNFVMGFVQVVVIFGVGYFFFGIHITNIPAMLLITAATVLAAVGFGLMVTALSKTQAQAGGLSTLLTFTLATIGGCYVPMFLMPSFMQVLAKCTPQGWAMGAYQDILIKGYDISHVMPAVGALAAFAVVFYLIGLAKFKFQAN